MSSYHFPYTYTPHAHKIGEKLVNFMVEPKKGTKWPKELPKFKTRSDAIAVCKDLCARQFMHRSEKVAKGELEVSLFILVAFSPMYLRKLQVELVYIGI